MSGKKTLKNIAWLVYNKIFGLLLNLFVTVKIVNHFGAEEYGSYAYAVSVVAVLEVIVTLVDGRITKKKYTDYDPFFVVFNSTIAKIILSVIAMVIGSIFMVFYHGDMMFNVMFAVLMFNSILTNLRFGMENHFEYHLQSKRIVIRSNVALLVASVLQFIAVQLHFSILSLCLISTLSAVVSFFVVYLQYRKEYHAKLWNKLDHSFVTALIKESIPLAVAAAAATIYTKCDSIMLGNMLGNGAVGVYAVGLKLFSIAQIAIVPVRTSIFPKQLKLYNSDKKQYAKLYIQVSSAMTWMCIAGIICCYTIVPPIFAMFFSTEYVEALRVFQINVFAVLFLYNSVLRTAHYSISGHTSVLMYTQIACAVMNIVLNAILIPKVGINGAAIATVITQGCSVLGSNYFFPEGKEVFRWQLAAFNPMVLINAVRSFVRRRKNG